MLVNLPAFLASEYQRADNTERMAFLGACLVHDRNLASSQLYADIFAADAAFAQDPIHGHRFSAARAAALVGQGIGADVSLSTEKRAAWRQQARQWLLADLAVWQAKPPADYNAAQAATDMLRSWQAERDLAGLREPFRAEFSAEERAECQALWKQVETVRKSLQP
jgi:hypothetical protein